jgi:hypothetical protein
VPLPPGVVATASAWLDELDVALVEISGAAQSLESDVAASVDRAARDVAERVAHFRRALAGHVDLADLLPSRWVPLGHVDVQTAERICEPVQRVACLPPQVLRAVHSVTDDNEKSALLRQVGEVASAAFVNLARLLREDHPHLAPPGWHDSSAHL